ncbi:hypothetical protein HMPREF3188_00315 [Tissierellia bacterium KA00581]|nr:hypothetical protein HMPREF3188_00315 [Tissierellia bacterium KA00581]
MFFLHFHHYLNIYTVNTILALNRYLIHLDNNLIAQGVLPLG